MSSRKCYHVRAIKVSAALCVVASGVFRMADLISFFYATFRAECVGDAPHVVVRNTIVHGEATPAVGSFRLVDFKRVGNAIVTCRMDNNRAVVVRADVRIFQAPSHAIGGTGGRGVGTRLWYIVGGLSPVGVGIVVDDGEGRCHYGA